MAETQKNIKSKNTRKSQRKCKTNRNSRNSKQTKKFDEDFESMERDSSSLDTGSHNDPAWYTTGPNGSIPFNLPFSDRLGEPIQLNAGPVGQAGVIASNTVPAMPGIMVIPIAPTFGQATQNMDPINISVFKLHAALRYGQAYSHTYDAAHLAYHLIAADSAMMLLEYWKRLYGLLRYYSSNNRYFPEDFLRAMGIEPSTFLGSNFDAVREYINHLVDALSVIKVPKDWTFFKRHQYMMSTIYADNQVDKCQFYCFVPAYVYKYTITTTEAHLAATSFWQAGYYRTFTALKEFTDDIINPLVGEDDVSTMAADFLRLYGSDGTYSWNHIDPNYSVVPMYDEPMLMQIHNCRPLMLQFNEMATADAATWDVTQNVATGAINFVPRFTRPKTNNADILNCCFSALVDVSNMPANADLVAESTRLIAACALSATDDTYTLTPYAIASDVAFEPCVFYYNASSAFNYSRMSNYTALPDLFQWTKFNFGPIYYRLTTTTTGITRPYGIVGQIDNYAVIDHQLLERMNHNAMLSMMQVPVLEEVKVAVAKK
nr:putative capsid [Marmot picobirnavirus]